MKISGIRKLDSLGVMFARRATDRNAAVIYYQNSLISRSESDSKEAAVSPTWLEMRSSHTDRAIWMALALCVTEMAFSLNLSRP